MGLSNLLRRLLLVGCAMPLFPGCSSESTNTSSGGGGSGGAPASCTATCDAIDSAGCPAESRQECLTICESSTLDCPTVASAFQTCVQTKKAQITCDGDGEAVYNGCQPEQLALAPCISCLVLTSDTPARRCIKEKCCAELKDAYSRADALEYVACVTACGSNPDACISACGTKFPEAAAKFSAAETCEKQHCPTPLGS